MTRLQRLLWRLAMAFSFILSAAAMSIAGVTDDRQIIGGLLVVALATGGVGLWLLIGEPS